MSPDKRKKPAAAKEAGANQPQRYRVINQRGQPVELHLAAGTVVVPPHAEIEIDEADVEASQIQTLQQRRELTVRLREGA